MSGVSVLFLNPRSDTEMATNGYSVHRNANDYVNPLRDMLFEAYTELMAYTADSDPEDEEYLVEIAELRGRCWALAYAIGSFHRPEDPEAGLAEARHAVQARWTEEYGEEG